MGMVFFREYIPVQEYFIIVEKMGEYEITGLGKKVVWVFPKRNGKIIGWLVGIPRGDCKIPLRLAECTHEWWSGGLVVWWTGGWGWSLPGFSAYLLPGPNQL